MKVNKNIDLRANYGSCVWPKNKLIVMESMNEAIDVIRSKPVSYGYRNYWNGITLQAAIDMSIEEIQMGNQKVAAEVSEKAEKWKNLVLEIEPSLDIKRNWSANENTDVWDAGKIAQGEAEPCFKRSRQQDQIRDGAAGGAYRIIISTDVSWNCSPVDGAGIMGALCLVLQTYNPVEIWIQQGWGAKDPGYPEDGVTLIPAFRGEVFNPILLSFWVGSPFKDNVFSEYLNRGILGRVNTACCRYPQMSCDMFMDSIGIPHPVTDEVASEWIIDIAKQILFENQTGMAFKHPCRNMRYE